MFIMFTSSGALNIFLAQATEKGVQIPSDINSVAYDALYGDDFGCDDESETGSSSLELDDFPQTFEASEGHMLDYIWFTIGI